MSNKPKQQRTAHAMGRGPLYGAAILAAFLTFSVVWRPFYAQAGESFPGFEYQNPIHFDKAAGWYSDRVRDPHIVRESDTYYLTHSMSPVAGPDAFDPHRRWDGSSPGIRLYSTKDFKTWTAERWLVKTDELPKDCPYRHQHFAPEINYIGGKYYLVFFSGNWRESAAADCFIGVADHAAGPYEHITRLKGAWCDVTLAEDDHGKVYAYMIGEGIRVQQVYLAGIYRGEIHLVGESKVAIDTSYAKRGLWHDGWTEGPWVKRRGNRYYLFYAVHVPGRASEQRVEYQTAVAYADHPLGPWTQDERPAVFWGGHLGVFDGPDGRWWYSYKNEKFHPGGEDYLCIDPLDFLPDGRVASREPTPYDQLVNIDSQRVATTRTVSPKPIPTCPAAPAWPAVTLLPPQDRKRPTATILGDWDFARSAQGEALPIGKPLLGSVPDLSNRGCGGPYAARGIAFPGGTGPSFERYAVPAGKDWDGIALDASQGGLAFPENGTNAALRANQDFSVWLRIRPLKSPGKSPQGLVTSVGRWVITRSLDKRLEVSCGQHLRDVLKHQGPILENDRWYEIGMTFSGTADPEDLHADMVEVFCDGVAIGKVTGRGMFDRRGCLQIGSGWYAGNQPFEGLIDRVIFWSGVVSSSEVAGLSNLNP